MSMKISNKFNLGDTVYYPAADLRAARIFKSTITGIIITEVDGEREIVYQTGQSYGVSEEDVFKTAKPAKRRLVKILEEKKKEIAKDIDKVIKAVEDAKTQDLVYDLTARDEEENKPDQSENVQ